MRARDLVVACTADLFRHEAARNPFALYTTSFPVLQPTLASYQGPACACDARLVILVGYDRSLLICTDHCRRYKA